MKRTTPPWLSLQVRSASGSRTTDLLLAIATLSMVFVLYQWILAPYVQNFFALKQSLKAHQELLNSKTLRTQAIQELSHAKEEYKGILDGLNSDFLSETEADLFIKGLPSTMSGFGNRVILFKPKTDSTKKSRSDEISDHIKWLNLGSKEKCLTFITTHKTDIDTNRNSDSLHNQLSAMLPISKRDEFEALWKKTSTDPLLMARVTKLELEVIIQGSYYTLLDLLTYLKDMNKGLEIREINVITLKEGILETSFVLSIYGIQSHE